MQDDTAIALDSVLIDAGAATAVRPAGLLYGVTAFPATTGGGFGALVGDIKGLVTAIVSSSNGRLREPVWLMNPLQALAISTTQNAGGDFPFAADMKEGMLQGYPVLQSTGVPNGTLVLLDAADFFSATGDEPRFEVSTDTTLHMEDTAPLQIGTVGSPPTVAAPVRSMFQTDSFAIRMTLDINWAMRRPGVVAFVSGVTW